MSIINKYLAELYSLIDELPFTLLTNIHPENRGEVALYITGEIIFVDRRSAIRGQIFHIDNNLPFAIIL